MVIPTGPRTTSLSICINTRHNSVCKLCLCMNLLLCLWCPPQLLHYFRHSAFLTLVHFLFLINSCFDTSSSELSSNRHCCKEANGIIHFWAKEECHCVACFFLHSSYIITLEPSGYRITYLAFGLITFLECALGLLSETLSNQQLV